MTPRRKLFERLQRNFPLGKEERDQRELLKRVRAWHNEWLDVDADCHSWESRGPVRAAILHARRNVIDFCTLEAGYLPSRVLRRRVLLLDDQVVRMVNNALPKINRVTLDAEVAASVINHGGPAKAHRARLLRSRYGIPRF
jgi:hypothetical protein